VTLASLSMTLLCEGLRPHRGTIHLSRSLENSRYLLEGLWESAGCNSAKLYLPDSFNWQVSLSHLIQSKETRVRLESHLFNSWGLCLIPRTLGQHPWSQNPAVAPTTLELGGTPMLSCWRPPTDTRLSTFKTSQVISVCKHNQGRNF